MYDKKISKEWFNLALKPAKPSSYIKVPKLIWLLSLIVWGIIIYKIFK